MSCTWGRLTSRLGQRAVRTCTLSLIAAIVLAGCIAPAAPPAPGPIAWPSPKAAAPATASHVRTLLGSSPLLFEENRGQTDPRVQFTARANGLTAFFTPSGVTYRLIDWTDDPSDFDAVALGMRVAPELVGPSSIATWQLQQEPIGGQAVQPIADEPAETIVSYLRGRQDRWLSGIPTYHSVTYSEVWPGIDAVYRADGQQLKSAYVVRPGADPRAVRLRIRGGQGNISEQGELIVETPIGRFRESVPVAWQDTPRGRVQVVAHFDILSDPGDTDLVEYGFTLGAYDPDRPLIVDPTVAFAGFVGGDMTDEVLGVAADGSGAAYATGLTRSAAGTFEPTPGAADVTLNGLYDAFILKVNPAGSGMVYKTYLGGDGTTDRDYGWSIALLPSCVSDCAAYITGIAGDGTGFPTVGGALDSTLNGYEDAFAAKLNADGTALLWCGFIGGTSTDAGYGITVDDTGDAYVTGTTDSNERVPGGGFPNGSGAASLPFVHGLDQTINNGLDNGFVAKLSGIDGGLKYWSYIGGSSVYGDRGFSIAVDGSHRAYVTGYTYSSEATFPNGNGVASLGAIAGFDQSFNGATGERDAFVLRLTADGMGLDYFSYIGGAGHDYGASVKVDGSNAIYLVGLTQSEESSFPNGSGMAQLDKPGFDKTYNAHDGTAFAIKLLGTSSGPDDLVYATYLGGTSGDDARAVALPRGCASDCVAFVAGETSSSDFNGVAGVGSPDPLFSSNIEGFVVALAGDGTSLIYGTYLGGAPSKWEQINTMAATSDGRAIVGGFTQSNEATFPTGTGFGVVPTTFDGTFAGGTQDGFVAALNAVPTSTFTPTATSTSTATAIATSTATATATMTATSTATATSSSATATSVPTGPCSPRPQVAVQTARVSADKLQVTVAASEQPATPGNRIASVAFDRLDNGKIDVTGGPVNQSRPFTYTTAQPRPQTVTFFVTRIMPGQAMTIHLRIVDTCGAWSTFVGGGPNAF